MEEIFASGAEHGETEQGVIQRLGTPEEYAAGVELSLGKPRPGGKLAALGGLGWCGWRQLSGKGNGATGAVSVLFLAQFLPWVLVSRCTFLYHYFPSLWFAVAALALAVFFLWKLLRGRRE